MPVNCELQVAYKLELNTSLLHSDKDIVGSDIRNRTLFEGYIVDFFENERWIIAHCEL